MKVCVTGGTGFVGSAVVRHLLDHNYPVRALVRNKANIPLLEGVDVELVEGDVRSLKDVQNAVTGCDYVVDLASIYVFLPFWEKRGEDVYASNVEGTVNVMQAALDAGVKRVVHTSSIVALGQNEDGSPTTEETEFNIKNPSHYARSKHLAEEKVFEFIEKGLPVVVLNPGIVLGQRDYKPTPSGEIIVNFLNRKYPGYFDTIWGVADVDDVAKAHVNALTKGRVGERYILCNKKHHTMKELFKLLENISGVRSPGIRFPHFVLSIYVHIDEWFSRTFLGKGPLISTEGFAFCKNFIRYDNSKAVEELSYVETPIEETLNKAISWYQTNGYVKQ